MLKEGIANAWAGYDSDGSDYSEDSDDTDGWESEGSEDGGSEIGEDDEAKYIRNDDISGLKPKNTTAWKGGGASRRNAVYRSLDEPVSQATEMPVREHIPADILRRGNESRHRRFCSKSHLPRRHSDPHPPQRSETPPPPSHRQSILRAEEDHGERSQPGQSEKDSSEALAVWPLSSYQSEVDAVYKKVFSHGNGSEQWWLSSLVTNVVFIIAYYALLFLF